MSRHCVMYSLLTIILSYRNEMAIVNVIYTYNTPQEHTQDLPELAVVHTQTNRFCQFFNDVSTLNLPLFDVLFLSFSSFINKTKLCLKCTSQADRVKEKTLNR